jgi:hypothetical protein
LRLLLRYDKAVELAISSKNYDEAMELALEHKVILTEAMVEGMTLEKKAGLDDKALNAQRNELLLKIAATCKQQNSFHLAAKKCVGSASLAFVVSPPCLFVRPFVCFARQIHARAWGSICPHRVPPRLLSVRSQKRLLCGYFGK